MRSVATHSRKRTTITRKEIENGDKAFPMQGLSAMQAKLGMTGMTGMTSIAYAEKAPGAAHSTNARPLL